MSTNGTTTTTESPAPPTGLLHLRPRANGRSRPSFTKEERREVVLSLLRSGLSEERIVEVLRPRAGWGDASVRAALRDAAQYLEEGLRGTSPIQRLAIAIEQREAILEKALANDDLRPALAILDSRDKLLGLASAAPGNESGSAPQALLDLLSLVQQSENEEETP